MVKTFLYKQTLIYLSTLESPLDIYIFQVNVYSRVPNVTVVPKSVRGNFFLKINKAVGDLQQNVQNEDM